MKKIGIITYDTTVDNYGQVLQYLATQEFFKLLGYKAVLVHPKGWKKLSLGWFKSKAYGLKTKIKSLIKPNKKKDNNLHSEELEKLSIFNHWNSITQKQEQKHPRYFQNFKQKFFQHQSGSYNDIINSNYAAYCVGSDQTWSHADYYWLLGWTPKHTKRFSIAPSVGYRKYSERDIIPIRQFFRYFNFITVRENSGIEFCHRCGYNNAIKVLDPTFLLSSEQYDSFADKQKNNKPYILIYLLGGEICESVESIIDFCKKNGYDVKYVESQGRFEHVENKIFATIGEWLSLVKNASYVLTNSYHGTIFAIIYRKPFLIFPLINLMKDMNGRIHDLTDQFCLQNRLYQGNFNQLFQPIDWHIAERKILKNKHILTNLIKSLNL